MKIIFLILSLTFNFYAIAHEGHEKKHIHLEDFHDKMEETAQERATSWTEWIGSFHLILLHFPIALINMLVVSEILQALFRRPLFEFSSQFLVMAAAILSPLTAILGLIYSYSAFYDGLLETFLFWHMWLGILTAILAVIIAFIREKNGVSKLYYSVLLLLFLLVNITSFFGGGLTFGPYHMLPPI